MGAKIFKLLILFAMGVNGALYLGWLLSSPNPDRIGYWYSIYFVVFPILALLGLTALVLKKSLHFSGWIGGILLLYVLPLTLITNSHQLGLGWAILGLLPPGGFELLHLGGYVAASMALLVVMLRR